MANPRFGFEGEERFVFDEPIGGDVGLDPGIISQISNALAISPAASSILEQVTLPDISAAANDLLLPTGTSFRATATGGAQDVTGFSNVKAGRQVEIMNVGVNNIVLRNQNAGSAAENRIITGTAASVTIQPDRSARLTYDGTTTRWRLIAFT